MSRPPAAGAVSGESAVEARELAAALGRPELRRLFAAARERRERLGRVGGRLTLEGASREERRAVADLLGLATLPGESVQVDLRRLDRALRRSRFDVGLDEALIALGGPLRDLPAERREEHRRWRELWAGAAAHPLLERVPALGRWLEALEGEGLLRRLSGEQEADRLLAGALQVLAALPALRQGTREGSAAEALPLPVLASRALGSSHALDPGRPAATLVLRALAVLAGRPAPAAAAERRQLWEWAGVLPDELSCDVLTLGLAPRGGGAVGEALRLLAGAGEPARFTLRQLLAPGLAFPSELTVRVCENPVVVAAAADRWGAAARPLVCIGGQPNQAARRLLGELAGRGGRLLYHGDFDWAGLRIANGLGESLPLTPWRFTAAHYRSALAAGAEGPPLTGPPADAAWDPELAAAMAAAGTAVEEEAVLEELLEDLGR